MGLLLIKISPVKHYSYRNDFSGVFDALHQFSFVFLYGIQYKLGAKGEDLSSVYSVLKGSK